MADADRDAAALDWVRRIHDPTFAGWDEHIAWLEADPANAVAFDRWSLHMESMTDGLAPAPPPIAENDNQPSPARRWHVWGPLGGLAAAALVAGVLLPGTLSQPGRVIETAPGEQRVVALADGTRIALNGDSRLTLASSGVRDVSLDRGEAFFAVVHDAAQPFAVHAGATTVRDLGTAFNLTSDGDRLAVAVREGSVDVERSGQRVHLPAGRGLVAAHGTLEVSAVHPRDVGGWRSGRLAYTDAALPRVARDVTRATGVPIRVVGPADARRFTGTLMLDVDRPRLVARLAAVTGLEASHDPDGWTLRAPRR